MIFMKHSILFLIVFLFFGKVNGQETSDVLHVKSDISLWVETNFAKNKILNIRNDILNKKGSVSKEVCIDMAINVKEIFNSDFAVGVTGFAGPGNAGNGKKVGLVFCGVVGPDGYKKVFEKNFIGSRSEIKFRTAQFVLNKLRIAIDNIIK